ncbi:DinB family protein [Flavihumibacter rivuli]|uniref:DinB family protein n=1 Tax=Flavihumibacter rivuli TaxID=2838156 RepID=UPI001BDDE809|nr:DinB family protein [Flavihumibacter rivuli]ULQ55906.1 DinB family protein [Flavihumibacter rivuli]
MQTPTIASQIAKHFREVHTGGNWTWVNLKEQLADISWEEAVHKREGYNTILALTYHIHYYENAILNVLKGNPINSHHQYSFDHPSINNQQEWEAFVSKVFEAAEIFAQLVEQLPEPTLWETFADPKYGNYYRNLHGVIEHTHYHLGQIVVLKKMIRES